MITFAKGQDMHVLEGPYKITKSICAFFTGRTSWRYSGYIKTVSTFEFLLGYKCISINEKCNSYALILHD